MVKQWWSSSFLIVSRSCGSLAEMEAAMGRERRSEALKWDVGEI